MNDSTARRTSRAERGRAADLVRWGPVVAGVVIGLAVFALLDALWFAIAAGDGNGWVTGDLDWYVGGTAIAALLVAGFLAGLLSGARGSGAGLANGITTWGLLVVLSLLGGIPGALGLSSALHLGLTAERALWTLFWSLLIGLACAGLGGALGGAVRRPVVVAGTTRRDAGDQDEGDHEAGPPAAEGRRTTHLTGNHVVEDHHVAVAEGATAAGARNR